MSVGAPAAGSTMVSVFTAGVPAVAPPPVGVPRVNVTVLFGVPAAAGVSVPVMLTVVVPAGKVSGLVVVTV